MKNKALHWFSMAAIIQVGLFRLYETPRAFDASRYMGVLFAATFILALIAALRIYRDEAWGWTLGALISAGSMAGFIWTRTFGFAGIERQNWLDPLGLVSLVIEIGFICLFILHLKQAGADRLWMPDAARGGWILPAAAFLLVVFISLGAYQLDLRQRSSRIGHPTVYISQEDLANEYGINVSQVAVSAMGSIIDMRIRIFDLKKASNLLGNPDLTPYLLVDSNPEQVILSAYMGQHHLHNLQSGGIFVLFFPNPRNSLKPGTPVSLAFGNLRVEAVVLK
jgi:hypothetical protein